MNLLIEAANIGSSGGIIHLRELLAHSNPGKYGISKIIIAAPSRVLDQIEEQDWLIKRGHPLLNGSILSKWLWKRMMLKEWLKEYQAFLFVDSTFRPPFNWPHVTICHNLLPLERKEIKRYGISLVTLRLWLLRFAHLRAYKKASGVIFLTRYCLDVLPKSTKKHILKYAIVPHGVNKSMFKAVEGKQISSWTNPIYTLLYVSAVDVYKHQEKIAEAVISLNRKGYPIRLRLVGPSYLPALRRLNQTIEDFSSIVQYVGPISYTELQKEYGQANGFIFGSSCESFGMILTEAMAMGLPIACSSLSSLPETGGDGVLYFNPLEQSSIEAVILDLFSNQELSKNLSARAVKRATEFTWESTSHKTWEFISEVAKGSSNPETQLSFS